MREWVRKIILRASVGCERVSEHLTRRDENHKYRVLASQPSSVLLFSKLAFEKRGKHFPHIFPLSILCKCHHLF